MSASQTACPSNPLPARDLHWSDEAATLAAATRLAQAPGIAHALVLLQGDLGAGKTTFVRHLLRALGVQGRVKSPTYAVVEPHEVPGLAIWHFDFYRFTDPREWEDAGFRELLTGPGLKLVEWPEHAAGLLPAADLVLALAQHGEGQARNVRAQALSDMGAALLNSTFGALT